MKFKINKATKRILIAATIILTLVALIVPAQIKISEKYVKSGNENLKKRYYKSALLDYEKASTINPRNESLKIQLGDLYLLFGDNKKAKEEYKKATKTNPKNTQAWNRYIKAILLEKDLFKLSEELIKIPEKIKKDEDFAVQYSRALASTGNIKEAINIISRKKSEESLFYQSVYSFSLNNYEKAIEIFESIPRENSLNHFYKTLGGTVFSAKKSNSNIYQKTIVAQTLNEIDEPYLAEKILKDVVKENTAYRDGYLFLGYSYFLQKNVKEAKENIKKTIKIDPFYGLAYFFQAKCNFFESDKKEGKESLENAIKFGLKNAEVYSLLAKVEMELENWPKAEKYFKEALFFDENSEKIIEGLVESLLKQGKIVESRDLVNQKSENNYLLGLIEIEEGNFENAENFLKKSLTKNPYSAKVAYKLSLLYEKIGDLNKKEEYIKKTREYDITGHWEQLTNKF